MKVFLAVFFLAVSLVCEGQELTPKKGENGKYGYIDKTGAVVIPLKYDGVDIFYEGLATVKLNGKWGYIDKTGTEVISFKYSEANGFSKGLAPVKLNGKWGYIDKTGTVVIPFKYDNAYYFYEGLAAIYFNYKYGYIDKTGTEIIPFKYDNARYFSEGLASVKLNGKWGYIDKTGTVVIPFKYDDTREFSEGLAPVSLNDKWGCIDKTGAVVIPFKYGYTYSFFEGLAQVFLNGKWGCVDKTGAVVVPVIYDDTQTARTKAKEYRDSFFSAFAKRYVEPRINAWQKKGEFERTGEWRARVTEAARQAEIARLVKEAERQYIEAQSATLNLNLQLGEYDADNEVFPVAGGLSGQPMLVPVPRARGRYFKEAWPQARYTPVYYIENDRLAIAEMTFQLPSGEKYQYSNQASLTYTVAQVDYHFEPIDISIAGTSGGARGGQTFTETTLTVGKADVDVDIPKGKAGKKEKTFAVVIANEHYRRETPVEFARNDGEVFRQYAIQTLGLPAEHVHYVADATLNDIRMEIGWLARVTDSYEGEASVLFYYAGHGIPGEHVASDNRPVPRYLLPVDGYGSDVASGYKLDDLYAALGKMPAKSVTVFIDACFSGAQRDGKMLTSERGVAVETTPGTPLGRTVVFAAAQGSETAHPYREKGHGLFTYFLLKKLQETKGDVSFGDLSDYITTSVKQHSTVYQSKSQTPTVDAARDVSQTWRSYKL
ncbi:MAG: WG repeat-containing protein [Prevotellaceae bacterium]|jgi:hypothetical protein|nr:WG repeat-containing protein [Prevotellaceae bacterium]